MIFKYSPDSLATINNNTSLVSIISLREVACICLQNSYVPLDFEVLKQDDTRYADGDQVSLTIFGPVALVSEAKLTTSSGKHLEKIDNLRIISIVHKLLTSHQQTSDLMYCFEESQATKRQELTNNKTENGTFFVNIKLIDFIGFADQEKVTYGLGYTLTIKRNNTNDPIIKDNTTDAAKIVLKNID